MSETKDHISETIIMSEPTDHLSNFIDTLLQSVPDSPYKPSIFRVPDDFRCVDHKLYEPKVLAVGPFHHGKKHLQKMEQDKLMCLKSLLTERKEFSVDKYVKEIRSMEEEARRCYAEPIDHLIPDDFVQMLLLDGIFIIELIREHNFDKSREQVLSQLRHDLMLVENQVPFFVLKTLFSMTESGNAHLDILYLIQRFFNDISPWPDASTRCGEVSMEFMENIDHLLGLVYRIWCSYFDKMIASRPVRTEEHRIWCSPLILCYSFAKRTASRLFKAKEEKMLAINSTSELQDAGIQFLKYTERELLHIKFTNGVMKIPGFHVSDTTESFLRNLIVYEHFVIDNHPKYVTHYAFFWDCLINSSKDVVILRRQGIVTNFLGDDERVCHMFNRLCRNIVIIPSDFYYKDVFDKVNEHCGYSWNRWMANLRRNYFNSPWAFISFFAALVLLGLTLAQTVYSVLSYNKSETMYCIQSRNGSISSSAQVIAKPC